MKKRHGKSVAREHAIKSLYSYYFNDDIRTSLSEDKLANNFFLNTIENKEQIDKIISKFLRKWAISELNKVNLAILEIATYELLFEDTPTQVIVNEALEFAKKYSDIPSKNFIHKVLDNISKE